MSLLGKFRKNTFLQLSFVFGDVALGNVDKAITQIGQMTKVLLGAEKKAQRKAQRNTKY